MTKYQGQRRDPPNAREMRPDRKGGSGRDRVRAVMTLYGAHTVEAALDNPRREVLAVLASENAAQRLAPFLARRQIDPRIVRNEEIAARLPDGAVHQGVLAEVAPLPPVALDTVFPASPIIALDQVCDPHNVGAILRLAAAFGAAAVIAPERGAPAPSGAMAKAASGALEHVPYIQITNLARSLDEMKRAGYWVVGLDAADERDLVGVVDSTQTVLVLGAEGPGLRRLTRERCDILARIALPGAIKSLNVSNAAAIALYALNLADSGAYNDQ